MANYEKISRKILRKMKKLKSSQAIYWTFLIDYVVNLESPQPIFYGSWCDAFVKFAKHFPTDWMYFVETAVDTLGENADIRDLIDEISDWSSNSDSAIQLVQLQIYE